jgi:hypothetical protein
MRAASSPPSLHIKLQHFDELAFYVQFEDIAAWWVALGDGPHSVQLTQFLGLHSTRPISSVGMSCFMKMRLEGD